MSAPAWDRTRWDGVQACALVLAVAVLSLAPAWGAFLLLTSTTFHH